MKKISFLSLLFFSLFTLAFFQKQRPETWNADAGLVPSYTEMAGEFAMKYKSEAEKKLGEKRRPPLMATSNPAEMWKILDGDPQTAWQSGAMLPDGFWEKNYLKNGGKGAVNLKSADGDPNTNAVLKTGTDAVEIIRERPSESADGGLFFLKCEAKSRVDFQVFSEEGAVIFRGEYLPSENYSVKKFTLPGGQIPHRFRLRSEADFLLFEIAALDFPLTESVTIDFGATRPLGMIQTRHWAGGGTAKAVKVYAGDVHQNWQFVAELDPEAQHTVLTELAEEVPARYLKIEYELVPEDWQKVFLWEVKAYDRHGPYGPRPPANVGAVSLQDMLGVNGYWSWGTLTCSADLPKGEGPARYAPVSSHGRNYHDMTWDIERPGQPIDFSKMKTSGTPAKAWLRWDAEYRAWTEAGMSVQASLQFHHFSLGQWQDAENQSFAYAKSYTEHFGLTNGNGLVCTVEAGNEPWKYPAGIYQKILLGMAKGAKAGDPAMEVFPCALQAADPSMEQTDVFKNYIGARVTPEAAQLLDGVNVHAYSYVTDGNGRRRAVRPEHPRSTFWEILNAIRWRDVNMPGKKIYLSEWGWDSDGAGEDCTHDECVSEQAAASYAVRAALIASRLGLDRATWFFYGNTEPQSSLYTRSGLTASGRQGFAKKKAFHALHSLVNLAGQGYFHEVVREDETAWAYLLADYLGRPTSLIVWRPVDGDDERERETELKLPYEITRAVRLDGSGPEGREIGLPKKTAGGYQLKTVAVPTLYLLRGK